MQIGGDLLGVEQRGIVIAMRQPNVPVSTNACEFRYLRMNLTPGDHIAVQPRLEDYGEAPGVLATDVKVVAADVELFVGLSRARGSKKEYTQLKAVPSKRHDLVPPTRG